jgi:hypothetical protein
MNKEQREEAAEKYIMSQFIDYGDLNVNAEKQIKNAYIKGIEYGINPTEQPKQVDTYSYDKLKQIFLNESDCTTQVRMGEMISTTNRAMTEGRFVRVVKKLLSSPPKRVDEEKLEKDLKDVTPIEDWAEEVGLSADIRCHLQMFYGDTTAYRYILMSVRQWYKNRLTAIKESWVYVDSLPQPPEQSDSDNKE